MFGELMAFNSSPSPWWPTRISFWGYFCLELRPGVFLICSSGLFWLPRLPRPKYSSASLQIAWCVVSVYDLKQRNLERWVGMVRDGHCSSRKARLWDHMVFRERPNTGPVGLDTQAAFSGVGVCLSCWLTEDRTTVCCCCLTGCWLCPSWPQHSQNPELRELLSESSRECKGLSLPQPQFQMWHPPRDSLLPWEVAAEQGWRRETNLLSVPHPWGILVPGVQNQRTKSEMK
jgi:hypothetical protein